MIASSSPALNALNAELRAADASLVGNEDVLRAVLSGCGDCLKILDLTGRLQFMSEGGKRVMEVDDFASLKGCPWPDFWVGEGNAEARKCIEAARSGETRGFKGSAATAKGSTKYWDVQVSPIFGFDGSVTHLLSISRDITAEWMAGNALKEAAERQHILSLEMSHRVNNTITVIAAIAAQTLRGDSVGEARETFMARLTALAEANRLLLQDTWASASIEDVVRRALAPHDPGSDRVRVAGPLLQLPSRKALSLALAIHELATNAMKYGALSNNIGGVSVEWSLSEDDGGRGIGAGQELVLTWRERGGPQITAGGPTRKGFGSRLIRNVLAQDFDGAVTVDYGQDGVIVALRAPRP